MAAPSRAEQPLLRFAEDVGRSVARGLEFFGFDVQTSVTAPARPATSNAFSTLPFWKWKHVELQSKAMLVLMTSALL